MVMMASTAVSTIERCRSSESRTTSSMRTASLRSVKVAMQPAGAPPGSPSGAIATLTDSAEPERVRTKEVSSGPGDEGSALRALITKGPSGQKEKGADMPTSSPRSIPVSVQSAGFASTMRPSPSSTSTPSRIDSNSTPACDPRAPGPPSPAVRRAVIGCHTSGRIASGN